jgi:hypothetical protein
MSKQPSENEQSCVNETSGGEISVPNICLKYTQSSNFLMMMYGSTSLFDDDAPSMMFWTPARGDVMILLIIQSFTNFYFLVNSTKICKI